MSGRLHEREWVVTDIYGDQWRIHIPLVTERGTAAKYDWEKSWKLEVLIFNAFDHAGAREDEIAAPLIEIYDALTNERIGDRLPHAQRPTRDREGVLAGFERDLRRELLGSLRNDFLRMEEVPRAAWPFLEGPESRTPAATVEPVLDPTTYFVLRVVDEMGASVDGISIVFTADGRDTTMKTDPSGMARIDGVHGSNASVRLGSIAAVRDKLEPRWAQPRAPNIPQGDGVVVRKLRDDAMHSVALKSAALATLVITPCTWIEIQLIGEDGHPIPGEAYRLELPDGSTREGRLDADGLARVDDVDPGTCLVTFPKLDEEAWARS